MLSLETIDVTIERQRIAIAKAPPHSRYSEILQLQMLREMKEILEKAYQLRLGTADLHRLISEDTEAIG